MKRYQKIAGLAVLGVIAAALMLFASGLAAFTYLVFTEPSLTDIHVSQMNSTHEKVSRRTDGNYTYLSKYVTTREGGWYEVKELEPGKDGNNFSVVTDIHTSNLQFQNRSFNLEEITGYKVQISAWKEGEVASREILVENNTSKFRSQRKGIKVKE